MRFEELIGQTVIYSGPAYGPGQEPLQLREEYLIITAYDSNNYGEWYTATLVGKLPHYLTLNADFMYGVLYKGDDQLPYLDCIKAELADDLVEASMHLDELMQRIAPY